MKDCDSNLCNRESTFKTTSKGLRIISLRNRST